MLLHVGQQVTIFLEVRKVEDAAHQVAAIPSVIFILIVQVQVKDCHKIREAHQCFQVIENCLWKNKFTLIPRTLNAELGEAFNQVFPEREELVTLLVNSFILELVDWREIRKFAI